MIDIRHIDMRNQFRMELFSAMLAQLLQEFRIKFQHFDNQKQLGQYSMLKTGGLSIQCWNWKSHSWSADQCIMGYEIEWRIGRAGWYTNIFIMFLSIVHIRGTIVNSFKLFGWISQLCRMFFITYFSHIYSGKYSSSSLALV